MKWTAFLMVAVTTKARDYVLMMTLLMEVYLISTERIMKTRKIIINHIQKKQMIKTLLQINDQPSLITLMSQEDIESQDSNRQSILKQNQDIKDISSCIQLPQQNSHSRSKASQSYVLQGKNLNTNLTTLKSQKTNYNQRKASLISGGESEGSEYRDKIDGVFKKQSSLKRRSSLKKSDMNLNSYQKDNIKRQTKDQYQQDSQQSSHADNLNKRKLQRKSSRPLSQTNIIVEENTIQVSNIPISQKKEISEIKYQQLQIQDILRKQKSIQTNRQQQAIRNMILEKLKCMPLNKNGLLVSGLQCQPTAIQNQQIQKAQYPIQRVRNRKSSQLTKLNNSEIISARNVNIVIEHTPQKDLKMRPIRFSETVLKDTQSQGIQATKDGDASEGIGFQFKVELSSKKDNIVVIKDMCSNEKQLKSEFSHSKSKQQSMNYNNSKLKETSPLRSKFNQDKEASPIKRWLKQSKTQYQES
ncbi:UNKNOWN [Stylonychia lemnae]|uniref:Uncharacterized protein n=1 Tax=Stylonychia lemnae TaxID=5949 RepID=A0A078ATV0_STYLE|nr:UNKNOWN [Stylonychia lemnae]|eukprot:CDW84662.1 UNKNOWN [Stylonychia lemnae]